MMKRINRASIVSLTFLSASALAQDARYTLSGTVQNEGGVEGVKVMACSMTDKCKAKTEARVTPINGKKGSFTLAVSGPGPYQLLAFKDMDGNGKSTPGDYLGIANDGNDVKAPSQGLALKMFKVSPELVAAADAPKDPAPGAASAATGSGGGLAGTWSQQSDATEAVMRTKLEDRPTIVTSSGRYGREGAGGFNLGGTTQYSRTIMRDKLVPVRVQRRMDLQIAPDGSFKWNIAKVEIDDSCQKTIRQQKFGRVAANGRQITFNVSGGQESQASDCGRGPEGIWNGSIDATQETYDYRQNGSTIMIDGGGDGWVFRRN